MHSKTRFNELLNLIPRHSFTQLVAKFGTDKHAKGFNSWSHLVALLFGQLANVTSLRELTTAYNVHSECHYHLGTNSVKRSTLSDANSHRDAGLFEGLCKVLMSRVHRQARKEAKELLHLLDSSPIVLNGRGHEWALSQQSSRVTGLKLHLLFARDAGVPCQIKVGPANENDITYAQTMALESEAMYVFDKGYCDYNWWYKIDQCDSYFVTRFKSNAGISVLSERSIEGCGDHILSDQVVTFKNRRPGGKRVNDYHGTPLRKVVVHREDKETPLVIASNDMSRSAEEIAALYKQRWDIELLFKWLKQGLKIKRFLGESENAVKIQIYVGLISYLLVHRYQKMSGSTHAFYLWLTELKATLFDRDRTTNNDRKRRDLPYSEALGRQVGIPL